MEPIGVRGPLRRHRVRHIRACNSHHARAAAANPCFHEARENVFACVIYLCTRAELVLFAAALAQLLRHQRLTQMSGEISSCTSRRSWFNFLRYARSGHGRRRFHRLASG